MFSYEIKIDEITPALVDAIQRLDRPEKLMESIAKLLVKSTKDRFPKGAGPDGAKWAAKSQTTLNRSGARKSNKVDTRPLFGPSGDLHTEFDTDSGADFAEVSTNVVYAAAMQFGMAKGYAGSMKNGSPIPWGDIPARPFLGFSDEDKTNILETIADYLGPAFKG